MANKKFEQVLKKLTTPDKSNNFDPYKAKDLDLELIKDIYFCTIACMIDDMKKITEKGKIYAIRNPNAIKDEFELYLKGLK